MKKSLPALPKYLLAILTLYFREPDFNWSDGIVVLIEQRRREYNQIRPHSVLRYRPPAPEVRMSVILT